MCSVSAFAAVLLLLATAQSFSAEEKITLGAVEEVMLLPCCVTLPARIDTGAETTSLDARDLTVRHGQAEFRLSEVFGGTRLTFPVVRSTRVKGAGGRQARPVVSMDMCIGKRKMHVEVTLADRSDMRYPLLVGRNVLEKGFLVDVSRTRISTPLCE
jgi:hypothetical protein